MLLSRTRAENILAIKIAKVGKIEPLIAATHKPQANKHFLSEA